MKKLLIGTNLKMYKGITETIAYLSELSTLTSELKNDLELFVIPSYTSLDRSHQITCDSHIRLGAQNMYPALEGQFTGEISPLMLKEVGVSIIEIGHSERRHVLGENDQFLNKKVLTAVEQNFTALLCIGETAEQKSFGISDEILRIQLAIGLKDVKPEQLNQVWIAYEPVWAIGVGGVPADPDYVELRHETIQNKIREMFGPNQIPVLYGGSVNPSNAEGLLSRRFVDGLFVGRAAWEAEKFTKLINQILPIWKGKNEHE